jgi:hypothetical protein
MFAVLVLVIALVGGEVTDLKVGPDGLLYVLSFGQGNFVVSRIQMVADFDGDIPTDAAG